jgi:hypothetical protein
MFHAGMIGVIGVFLLYLVKESALEDWINQSFKIGIFYRAFVTPTRFIGLVSAVLFFSQSQDIRLLLYSPVFYSALIICTTVFLRGRGKLKGLQQRFSEREKILFLFSSVTIFGYLQSLHFYQIFRLQNGSSLGFGLLIFFWYNLSKRFKRWKGVVFSVPLICLFIYLSQTLVFVKTASTFKPWDRNLLFSNQLKEPENIEMLQGKLDDEETRIFYQTLAKTMSNYNCQLEYLVNLSRNSYVPRLSKSFKRVQRSPFYSRELSEVIFQDEQKKITQLLMQEKAILIAAQIEQVPENYQVVLKLKIPGKTPTVNKMTYVAVPKLVASTSCPVTQVR